MLKFNKLKQYLMVCLLLSSLGWCYANNTHLEDGYTLIPIMESDVQGPPKGSSIQATIDGHTLSVVFLEHLGQVDIEIVSASGGSVQTQSTPTPFGVNFYIPDTGSYIVTFTLPNGDEYYGEFEVTD
jgi:hypothetical protein